MKPKSVKINSKRLLEESVPGCLVEYTKKQKYDPSVRDTSSLYSQLRLV